jgi:peptidoglycan/xylan/chitin deacetylase (PgdA/CDA1 family)
MYKPLRLLANPHLPLISHQLNRFFPQALWAGPANQPAIALTFDDGPHPADTPHLLDILAKHNTRATFFFLGNRLPAARGLVNQVFAAGHQVALHGYEHYPFPFKWPGALQAQLQLTQALLAAACDCDPANLRDVRPPSGLFTPNTLTRLARWGYRPVMWTVVPPHWLQPAAVTIQQAKQQVSNGALLVLHEDKPGPPVAGLADHIIPGLKAAGLKFVTVAEMWTTPAGSPGDPNSLI